MQSVSEAIPQAPRRDPWNKGKGHRRKAAAPTEARLVRPYQTAGRGTSKRPRDVQSRDR